MSRGSQTNRNWENNEVKDNTKRRVTCHCNPCKPRKDKRHSKDFDDSLQSIGFGDEAFKVSQERPFFDDYSDEITEVPTPVSLHTLKLFEFVREEEEDLVEDELASVIDRRQINHLSEHGFALIHVAARYNYGRIVSSLLAHGADIDIRTRDYRWTPLHLAARYIVYTFCYKQMINFYRLALSTWYQLV